jgi:hypothetical protein
MKTSLTLLALVTGIASPVAFAAELSGLELPAALHSPYLAAAFTVAIVGLLLLADYAQTRSILPRRATVAPLPQKSTHALAA